MKITTFCLCILVALAGAWMADLGAWASAGGIWVICLILEIDGAAVRGAAYLYAIDHPTPEQLDAKADAAIAASKGTT